MGYLPSRFAFAFIMVTRTCPLSWSRTDLFVYWWYWTRKIIALTIASPNFLSCSHQKCIRRKFYHDVLICFHFFFYQAATDKYKSCRISSIPDQNNQEKWYYPEFVYNRYYRGSSFQLQLCIHTTDPKIRNRKRSFRISIFQLHCIQAQFSRYSVSLNLWLRWVQYFFYFHIAPHRLSRRIVFAGTDTVNVQLNGYNFINTN